MGTFQNDLKRIWTRSTDWFSRSSEGYRCLILFVVSAFIFNTVELLIHRVTGSFVWLDSYVDYYGAITGSVLALMGTTATGYIFLIEYSRTSELRSSSPWMMMKEEMKAVFKGLVTISIFTIVINTAVAFQELEGLTEGYAIILISGLFTGLVGAFLVFDYDMVTADIRLKKSLRRFLRNIERDMNWGVEENEKRDGRTSEEQENDRRERDSKIEGTCKCFGEIENLFYEIIGLPKDEVMLEEYSGGRHIIPSDDKDGYRNEAKIKEEFVQLRRIRDILVALTTSKERDRDEDPDLEMKATVELSKGAENFRIELNRRLNDKSIEVKLTSYTFDRESRLNGCRFKDSTVRNCAFQGNVSMVGLNIERSVFSGDPEKDIMVKDASFVQLIQSHMSHLNFVKGSSEPGSGLMNSFDVSGCTILESRWNALVMERSKFMSSRIIGCKFRSTDFSQTMFDNTLLVDVEFDRCDLSSSRFDGCSLIGCKLRLSGLCDLKNCEVNGIKFNISESKGGIWVMEGCKMTGGNGSNYLNLGSTVATWQGNWIVGMPVYGKMNRSSVKNCKFSNVRFGRGDGSGSTDSLFENVSFINCEFDSEYRNTTFIGCIFVGGYPKDLDEVSFMDCKFSSKDAAIENAELKDCINGRSHAGSGFKAAYIRCVFGISGGCAGDGETDVS